MISTDDMAERALVDAIRRKRADEGIQDHEASFMAEAAIVGGLCFAALAMALGCLTGIWR